MDNVTNDSLIGIDPLDDNAMPKHESSPKSKRKTRQKDKPLRLINVNCQSLSSKIGAWKNMIECSEPDIIIATETWLKPEIYTAELELGDYSVYRRDRPAQSGGGVLVAVHNTISSTETDEKSQGAEYIWVKAILTGQQHLYIGACYRSNVADKTTIPQLQTSVENILANNHKNIILAGDFNLPGWDWTATQLRPNCPQPANHQEFKEFMDTTGLSQLVKKPTRNNNTLDLIMTNIPERVNRTDILPGISDHHICYTELSLRANRRKQAPRTIWLYKRANWNGLEEHITPALQQLTNSQQPVEEMWTDFKNIITEGAKKYIPTKTTKKQSRKPWISPVLEQKIKLKKRLHRKTKSNGGKQLEERYNTIRKEIQREFRKEHNKFVENILTGEDDDTSKTSKKFWAYVKQKRSDNSGVGTLRVNSKLITDPTEKAEALNRQFHSVFNPAFSPIPDNNKSTSDMPEIRISEDGVLALLMKLNPYKATGPDDLSPRLLKQLAPALSGPLTHLFQRSLDTSTMPSDWRKARVCPIFKKGDKYQPSNYRPISLTCVVSKMLEHIITSQVAHHLESTNKLTPRQHGFRPRRCCESQLIELIADVSTLMDQGKEVDACFLDFAKAFDKVDHVRLIQKLRTIGVNDQATNWIKDFLSNRTQVVVVDGFPSSPCDVTSGVPQGSVIGPILFTIFINDLPDAIKSSARLFADDTVVYNTTDNRDQLQQDLCALETWERDWKMEFNALKCEHIKFSRKRERGVNNTYTLHNIDMPKTNDVKYLGVKLENTLRWNNNTSFITGKASSRIGYIRRTIPPALSGLRNQAYKYLIRPVVEYSSTVWDGSLTNTQTNSIEAIQRRAARMVCNIKRTDHTTSTTQLLEHLEWDTLKNRRERRRLGIFRAMHYDEVAVNITDYLSPHPTHVGQSRKHQLQYFIPHCNTRLHQNSFFIGTARLWNALPIGSNLLEGPPVAG